MRIPRDLNGTDLARRLGLFGYRVTRQTGSHMRLTRVLGNVQQHLTIPAHKPLRVGTLRQILKDVAEQTNQSMEAVLEALGE
jgi:predicted RNA binding protein YcfA (HicA-like mRNA interferase family)